MEHGRFARRARTSGPAEASTAPRFSITRRVCTLISPPTTRSGRRIEGDLARRRRGVGRRERPAEYGPMASARSGLETALFAHANDQRLTKADDQRPTTSDRPTTMPPLTTLFDRRQRVQTRIRWMPPLIIARTFWRFGSNRRALDVVGMALLSSDDGGLPAEFTLLGHAFFLTEKPKL